MLGLLPCHKKSPHWFGGEEFDMPQCHGCAHPIRQWFVIDIREIPPLREKLPAWSQFPLLGCMDCMVWMGRHDYRLDFPTMKILLDNVATMTNRFGDVFGTLPPIPKQYVQLEWLAPNLNPSAKDLEAAAPWDRPQVAGTISWVQSPEHVFCRNCREEMVFVAALASTTGFEPYIPINNESGFQYHFACNSCCTISVIAQWT